MTDSTTPRPPADLPMGARMVETCDTGMGCDNCGAEMRWETSHSRCDRCGYIRPCCEGVPLEPRPPSLPGAR